MQVKVLGGCASDSTNYNLTAFLINGHVLFDAGTASSALSFEDLPAITHVVLTHAHLDHHRDLPFLIDNIIGRKDSPLEVVGEQEVIDTVHENIFNGKIWPDFSKLPEGNPIVKFRKLAPDQEAVLGELAFKPVLVNHSVPATGYIVMENDAAIVFSADTKATEAIWEEAARLGERLKAVFMECTFPDRMADLADRTCHLTPNTLVRELNKIKGFSGPVYAYHLKAQFRDEIAGELQSLGRNVMAAEDGMELEI